MGFELKNARGLFLPRLIKKAISTEDLLLCLTSAIHRFDNISVIISNYGLCLPVVTIQRLSILRYGRLVMSSVLIFVSSISSETTYSSE